MRVNFTSPKKWLSRNNLLYVFVVLIAGTTLAGHGAWSASTSEIRTKSSDVRVLIDVSGSMKKNDPKNLRLPALRLLIGLLPVNTSAAVWNFGSHAELIVKPGLATEKWKKNARLASKKIHSKDLFTNIGLALETAIADWGKSPSKLNQRSIILLTDGMIDISKDKAKNSQERTRILKELLPQIEKTGANIHTIALSSNADIDFLQQISTKTDGAFEQTDNAEQLERIFLRLFEKTTKPDTVPLVNNKFKVDESILELTLLVFKPQNAAATEIIEADQTRYKKSNSPGYAKWQSEKNYDLITISRPKVGEWSINAQSDPDNRVLVVTNLQVQTIHMPNNLFIGEALNIGLFMTDNNKKISDDNFLQFISMSAQQKTPEKKRWFLHDNGLRGDTMAHDGLFNIKIKKTLQPGKNTFTFQASTETLQREINYSVRVHDTPLINTRAEQQQKNNKHYHQILVTPNIEFINPREIDMSALLITGDLETNSDSAKQITLKQIDPKVLQWSYESDKLDPNISYHVIVHMITKTRTGRPVDYTSRAIELNLPQFDNLILSTEQPPDKLKTVLPAGAENTQAVIDKPAEAEDDWFSGIIIALIANIIVAAGGWFAYKKWQKSRETAYEALTGELE